MIRKVMNIDSILWIIALGAIVMFGIFLDEIEKGNLIIKENK